MRAEYIFWTCLALILYTYLLYPVLLWLVYAATQTCRDFQYLLRRVDRRVGSPRELPTVSLLIPAYNEEEHLAEKLANVASLDYPAGRLEAIFVSDGSTDGTNVILARMADPRFVTIVLAERSGKSAALNRAFFRARGDVLVLSDAATILEPDAVRKLVRHFADPMVGAVCGSIQFQRSVESAQTEGVYWQYEGILRLMETRIGATLTASGALYAVRRSCFEPLAPDTVLDDFVIPMRVRRQGYRVHYDPEARGMEYAPQTVGGEFIRRVRLAVGSFRAAPELLRSSWGGFTFVAFVSHKLLRWCLPFLLIALLFSNAFLLDGPIYAAAFGAQVFLLFLAGAGAVWRSSLERVPFGLISYFLSAMNLAFLVGFVRCIFSRTEATWQRTS